MKFFKDLYIMFITEVRRYYRWKERVIWDVLFTLISFFGFVLVWKTVLMGGFQGVGDLTAGNYITFLLIGSLLWVIIKQGIGWQMSYAFVFDKHRRVLPYLMISPLNKIAYLYGKLGVGMVRAILSNIIILIIAILFFNFTFKGSILLTLFFLILTFFAFSGIGLIISSLGAWREGLADFAVVISEALYLVSGVHYPIEVFPENIKELVNLLPTTQAINAVRAIGLHGATLSQIMPHIIYIGSLAIISPIIGYIVFKWVENKAMLIGI